MALKLEKIATGRYRAEYKGFTFNIKPDTYSYYKSYEIEVKGSGEHDTAEYHNPFLPNLNSVKKFILDYVKNNS